jgi:predicted RNA-binding protein with RPS1 domain
VLTIYSYKVENVEDVVSINDLVWVKVLTVTEQTDDAGRTRHKVQLSMKDVNQQDGTDISGENFNTTTRQDAQSQAIQQNLSSSIGLGFAEDPMANMSSSSSSLVFKHEKDKNKTLIRGYALLDDDDEGELRTPLVAAEQLPLGRGRGVPPSQQTVESTKPLGRGRGMTLPAWMTKQNDGPGQSEDLRTDKRENNLSSDDSSRRREKKRRKKHERSSRQSRHRRDRKHGKKHKRDDRKKDRRSGSESESDELRERTHKRSRRRDDRKRSRKHDDQRRRRRSRSYSESSGSVDDKFRSVEEAQSIIARLEKANKKDGGD